VRLIRNFEDTTAMFEKPQRLFVWDIESYEEADQGVVDLYNVLMDLGFNLNCTNCFDDWSLSAIP